MPSLDKLADYLAKPGQLSRRTALGKITRGCAVIAGVLAGVSFHDLAYAANVACCNLAYPNNICSSNYYSGLCPCTNCTPTNGCEYTWTCQYGHCAWVCGECWNCQCSYAFQLCGGGCPCAPDAPTLAELIQSRGNVRMLAAGEKCH